jgi:Tol biopolymer transport system component
MIYAERSQGPASNMLVWVDRRGASVDVDTVAARHQSPRLSPDGSQIAMTIRSGLFTRDLWIQDVQTGQRRQLTADEGDKAPDGRTLFFHESYPDRGRDIWEWSIDASGNGTGALLLATAGNERNPAISPDGRWLAYVSDGEDGDQVYLRRYPGDAGKQVSLTGGSEPVWSRDGSELFYRRGRDLFSVAVPEDSDEPGQPRHLFAGRFLSDPGGNVPSYDVGPDGSRFLMLRPTERATTLQVLSHWQSEVLTAEP